MPQKSVAIWNRVVFDEIHFFMRYVDSWKSERCSVERKGNDQE